MAAPLDTLVHVETPEGLEMALRPAGIVARVYAFVIDWILRVTVLMAIGSTLADFEGMGTALVLILMFALEWLYPVFFELTPSGATPGKRLLHLQVVMDNGLPVTPGASLLRNLLRVADFLPFAYGFGLLAMLCRRDFKRLGDVVAGTLVVYSVKSAAHTPLPNADPLSPSQPLTLDAQAVIVNLAMRAPRLTRERVEELASLLPAQILPSINLAQSTRAQRLFGLARWLMGHRTPAP